MNVYLEIGKKRAFAGALEWPGWCRSGKDEAAALETLFQYAPRYGRAIAAAGLGFEPPAEIAAFTIIERLPGNAGTDFGAPAVAPSADSAPVNEAELAKFRALFEALWGTFDAAAHAAEGKELRTGPRGGGRDLPGIIRHVFEAELAYLNQLGGKFPGLHPQTGPQEQFNLLRQTILTALGAAARGELPLVGPHGGRRWTPRFFIRYAAWHLLDHTWELEDRTI